MMFSFVTRKKIINGLFPLFLWFLLVVPMVFAQDLNPVIEVQPSTSVDVGEEVYFSATGSTYSDPSILAKARYEWDFGDGYYHRFEPDVTSITRSGMAVVHYYMKPGNFTATLKVTLWSEFNSEGTPIGEPLEVKTTIKEINVIGEAPMAGFEIQRAPFHNRLAQYLYVQIPENYRGNQTSLKVSLQGVKGSSKTLLSKNSLAGEEKVLIDHRSLLQDDYVIIAELLDADGQKISGGLWRDKFSKKYEGLPRIGIDENNAFRFNGELFFPIGPYMTDVPKIENFVMQANVNMLQTEGYYETHSPITWHNYLEEANKFDLIAIGPGRGDYEVPKAYWSPSPANRWKFNHNPDQMAKYVQQNKDNPAMFAWIWQDEPNMGGRATKVYPATLAAWGYVAHREDSQHPAYNLLYGYDWSIYYGTTLTTYDYLASASQFGGKKWVQDIISFDNYPIQGRLHPSMNLSDMGPYAVYLDSLDRIQYNNKNLVPILPALQPCLGQPSYTYKGINEEQVYLESWLNVIHGAKGILWFPYFDQTTIRWAAMKKFTDQMKIMAPVVLQAEPAITVVDDANTALNRVDTMIREYNGDIYIFSARVTEPEPITEKTYTDLGLPVGTLSKYTGIEPASITTTFTVNGLSGDAVVEVVDESRSVRLSNGSFTDTFPKNTVHIYKISGDNSSSPQRLRIVE